MLASEERILLVDDDPNVLSGYRRHLGRRYPLSTALSGAEALEILSGEPAAVVIADMRMPKMNGVQLLAEVEKRSPDTVRMMLTGNADQETAVLAVNRGRVFRFLTKPASVETVVDAIEAALDQYRLIRADHELVRQAEATLRALERERLATRQQREFVAMVSHEFRTPLAIIDSAVEILGGPYQVTDQQRQKRVGQIREAVRRMTDLMEGVLDVSRLDAGSVVARPEPIDLLVLVQTVVDRLQTAHPSHWIEFQASPLPSVLNADFKLLDHAFANIICNAIKYSPGRNRVVVRCASVGDEARVTIIDDGVGIPRDELPRLFDKFFRASTASGISGTGIGLFLANHFVRLHGGRIEVASEPGRGTTVDVFLPFPARD